MNKNIVSFENVVKEHLTLISNPRPLQNYLAVRLLEGRLYNKTVTIYVISF